MSDSITKDEFIDNYCSRSNITRERLMKREKAVPCSCDYELCEGWQMVPVDYSEIPGRPLGWIETPEDDSLPRSAFVTFLPDGPP